MSRRRSILIALVVLMTVVGFGGLTLYQWSRSSDAGAGSGKTTYYCPMHPDMKSERPGNCPICSMKLVPLEKAPASGGTSAPAGAPPAADAMGGPATAESGGSGSVPTVHISPERQQRIGIKFAAAQRVPARVEVRAVGKVMPDETRIAHIHTKVSGWIEDVFVNFVGQPVRRGQPLFTVYSPDLVAGQEEYLLAVKANRQLEDSAFSRASQGSRAVLAAARRRLELWDMPPGQIAALERTGKVSRTVTVYSPVSGVVTERAAYHHGRTITPELDLYTIVDMSRVWVQAEVYEADMGVAKVGQVAEVELPYEAQRRSLTGRVTFIAPFLNPGTRTVQVRMEFPNPNLTLKLDSFVNVRLRRDLGERLVVRRDAVMDTGKAQYVFVDKGEGYLEPRPITAGIEVAEGRVIEDGLTEGERVVTAANFILDSESRLRGAFEAMGRPQTPAPETAAAAPKLRVEVATSPTPAKVGKNDVTVTVADPAGKPVEDAEVEVRLFMPQMGAMAPMEAKATLKHEGAGRYEGEVEIPMAWSWETTVTVRKGGQVLGTAMTTITAR